MLPKLLDRVELERRLLGMQVTAFHGTTNDDSTRSPVLAPLVVLELTLALLAVELYTVQRHRHKTVQLAVEVEFLLALGAVGRRYRVLLLPRINALRAAKLVAAGALLWVLDHEQAEHASEVFIHTSGCVFHRKLSATRLIRDSLLNFAL